MTNNQGVNKEYLQKFAVHLKALRKSKGLTQDDLETDEISRSMISLIEIVKTDVTISKVKALADSLKVEVKCLFDFE